MKKILLMMLLWVSFLSFASSAFASGPLLVKGGMGLSYSPNKPILYKYDLGSLGKFSNSEAVSLINELIKDWEDLKTSDLQIEQEGFLDSDINSNNYKAILDSKTLLGYSVILFDNDGSIIDDLFGQGAGNQILGFAGPISPDSGPLVNEIAESQGVFNGRFINGVSSAGNPETTTDSFKGTVIHEFGHFLGFDHSQINVEAAEPGASSEIRDQVPLMFPIAVNDLFLIRRDDESAAALLYPNASELVNFGKIEGKVFRANGTTPVLGANVIARNVDNPKLEAVSCVSDFLKTMTGEFALEAVLPGNYRIEIEPIDLSFNMGSAVGPYSEFTTDPSFQNPVPKGFYTGPNQTITTNESEALIIMVQAGQVVDNVNIIASAVSSSSTSSTSGAVGESEPNDSPDEPQVISLPATIAGNAAETDSGEIMVSSEAGSTITISDLYKFTINQPSSINALLTIDSELNTNDLDLLLFSSDPFDIVESSSQTGNVDELISKSLSPGTYFFGVGAFSGSAPYELMIELFSDFGPSSLTIDGPDSLVLQPTGMNIVKLKVQGENFVSKSRCSVIADPLVRVRPRKFALSSSRPSKLVKVKVPLKTALDLINTGTTETVTVNVTCNNGASEEVDIKIVPTLEDLTDEDL